MRLNNQQLTQKLDQISIFVKNQEYEKASCEYQQLDSQITNMCGINADETELRRDVIADFYASYAYFLFASTEYEQFFEMYLKAQNYGYACEKRRNFLFEAFVQPNLDDFRTNYETNKENMSVSGCGSKGVEFNELPFWLITSGNENEYYLFDKKSNLIKEKITWDLSEFPSEKKLIFDSRDCDQIIIGCTSWPLVQEYLRVSSYAGKKTYFAKTDVGLLFSCLQGGIINQRYLLYFGLFSNSDELHDYFIKHSHYLPRKIVGKDQEIEEYQNKIEALHQLRLKKENRSGNNILLSIGIPSFNRGNRAYDNVMHTLTSQFDEEIEVIVSNNGTQNETKDYYQKINLLEDARVTYFEFDENQGVALNICKVLELAKGKFVLMTSDEDLIDLNSLRIIINILSSIEENDVAIVRTRTDGQGLIPYHGMAVPGSEAILNFLLTSNYMSGMIFNKEMLKKYKLFSYIRNHLENEAVFYYPHVVMELVLSQYAGIMGLNLIAINEGEPEITDVEHTEVCKETDKTVPYYATLEGRFKQHRGFFEVIEELEICTSDFESYRKIYRILSAKTFFLVGLSIRFFYREIGADLEELVKLTFDEVIKYLKKLYGEKKNSQAIKYKEDVIFLKKKRQQLINEFMMEKNDGSQI